MDTNYYDRFIPCHVGVTIMPPDTDPFTCRAALLGCTCDLPARAAVMNVVQFNGFYGCSHCLQEGTCMCENWHLEHNTTE